MSKELTEKFMNDELDDSLYYFTQKMSQDNVEIGRSFAFNMVRADDGQYLDWFLIHEVLAPVPTYDQFSQTVKKVEQLESRLKEAEKVIKFYADAQPLTDEEKQMSAEKYHLVYGLKANDYLEKYGVEK